MIIEIPLSRETRNTKKSRKSLCGIHLYLNYFLILSEPFRDVLHTAIGQAFHHALVGGHTVQWTQLSHITSHFDVVEMVGGDVLRKVVLSRIPGYLYTIVLLDLMGQLGYGFRLIVAAHEAHAGDACFVLLHKTIQFLGVQWFAGVFPQILAVATRALVGTVGDINGKRHFFRNFLEDDIKIGVF